MNMKKNNKYGSEYYAYITMLSSGNSFKIFICKRLLFRPVFAVWLFLFGLFLIPSNIFWAMVGLPCLSILSVYLIILFPFWNACNISPKAYIIFHVLILLLLKILSIPVRFLLEALWILCF